ncbi:Receptor-type guanylate cyclase gcy [Seminavis robusta]|uniref:Receptor-type guanylate cyclase gcy n=1 Tax=Seminavis robusta TaxID=568900 RepID=A0A9N8DH13_9STRA|nr:Receptor-type guanylate cyclase gcy [Seminavis robusta]|eukprot:Sro116_g057130.1 Receptor-type guanylate cyclase gcy (1181) ;mRNA; r:67462-72716
MKFPGPTPDGLPSGDDAVSVSSASLSFCNDGIGTSTTTTHDDPVPVKRDEIKEVQKMAKKDTRSVQLWRLVATAALLVTAFVVTYTTYTLLKREEKNNFETAFQQFSRTLSENAVKQMYELKDGLDELGNFISVWANSDKNNESFPFVTLPAYETIAPGIMEHAHIETLVYCPFVRADQKDAWLDYANRNKGWVIEGHMQQMGSLERLKGGLHTYNNNMTLLTPKGVIPDPEPRDYYFPVWLYSPPPAAYSIINANAESILPQLIAAMFKLQNETIFSQVRRHPGIPISFSAEEHATYHSKLKNSNVSNPHSIYMHPVYAKPGNKSSGVAAILSGAMAWDASFLNLLPTGVEGIHVVIRNTCNQTYSYNIVGRDAFYLGPGDHHEPDFDKMEVEARLDLSTHPHFREYVKSGPGGPCHYSMHIYPSTTFRELYDTNTPEIFAAVIAVTFALVAVSFFIYDMMQQRRNTNLIHKAAQSNSIVTSLFPDHMRDRLMNQAKQEQSVQQKIKSKAAVFLNDGMELTAKSIDINDAPLADLYLETTVLFADISGFTAWSSVREPSQVFLLLETLYGAFDLIAHRRRIFKVETVGDCYVAVCGLPYPRKDHAVGMAKFGRDILQRMNTLTKELEVLLGPDTGDLGLRIGIHSGPVTAGVLRGERARFQLFGDTVNTCGRIEGSGMSSRIHCSKETAELIKTAGKESWLEKRPEPIELKGKGRLETFWVTVRNDRAGSVHSNNVLSNEKLVPTASYNKSIHGLDEKTSRLIDWNVESLLRILRQIVAGRTSQPALTKTSAWQCHLNEVPLEAVKEIIHLPAFDSKRSRDKQAEPKTVEIPDEIVMQLHHLVSVISTLYNANPFHNFEHASHVVMSVTKLMSRIIAPNQLVLLESAAELHDHTYGITSDPLTQFACAFSALIHDVDHVGVSNAQLVKEGGSIAAKYKERSVAEQNSLEISWKLLMDDEYAELRSFLFETSSDLSRFQDLVVNSVMATDIVDKDLKALRNRRWDKAFKTGEFASTGQLEEDNRDAVNRKAIIIIEHIIQASDISHTMQHWQVYKKWNQKLFEELYVAYLNGRMEKNPSEFWYNGEFGFFDFYIIPLTQKLKDCGVFGVSSDEFLNYAQKNREEWALKGESVVAEFLEECKSKYGVKGDQVEIGHLLPRGSPTTKNVTTTEIMPSQDIEV